MQHLSDITNNEGNYRGKIVFEPRHQAGGALFWRLGVSMKKTLALSFFAISGLGFANAISVPVVIGQQGTGTVDACPSFGEVVGLKSKQSSFLAVRSGPSANHPILDKLKLQRTFHMCSYSKDSLWVGIVYSDNPSEDCGVSSAVQKPENYKGKFKSGWVHQKWGKVIAG